MLLCVVIWLCCALGLIALPGGVKRLSAQELTVKEQERALYLAGNISFVLFHEFGHALIDEFALAVFGQEEDAVDNLSALFMLPEDKEPLADDLMLAAMEGWYRLQLYDPQDPDQQPFITPQQGAALGAHAPDRERALNILCVLYGSDPEGFRDLALRQGLEEAKLPLCEDIYQRTLSGWAQLLAPYVSHQPADGPYEKHLFVRYEPSTDPETQDALQALQTSGRVEELVELLDRGFHWKAPITVSFQHCAAQTGWWDAENREIVFCYELLTLYDRLRNRPLPPQKREAFSVPTSSDNDEN